ncbi:alpha/beta fold hydrolase [Pseudonocardia sp. ICBG1293]|uniref:alpha/beta fold hydrolase n=1 Tax=Pseudonocardia sp. ICBG1293 TaxID=2844382 RepID=UPI001CCC0E52|nr:alpha/beta hydrolase [Pseudonocardia sp. ICBG1293]
MPLVHHRTATVGGQEIFYREAGPAGAPTIVLLHGYPTSSSMFRGLIPLLAVDHHVIAPDHLGFGHSAAPSVAEFDYTFDALASLTDALLEHLGVDRYALYVQDYGAPIGWRLALAHPERITGMVTQNGNGYEDGFVDTFWADVWAYGDAPGPDTEPAVRAALGLDAIRWQYLHGVPDPDTVDPDTWHRDHALVSRPGNAEIQLALFADYRTNRALYPRLHEFLRAGGTPVLAVWGRGDEIFGPDGARAFARDADDVEVHLVDGGHFLLESHLDVVAGHVRRFLGRIPG